MNPLLEKSSAYDMGYLIGMLMGLVILLGIAAFAVICIVKAFTKKTTGWIVAGCISGAVLSVPLIAFLVGVVSGFEAAGRARDSDSPDKQPSAKSSAKSSSTKIVRGRDIAYSLRIPNNWTSKRAYQDFDSLNFYRSLYVGVIAEESNLGSPQTIAKIARDKIKGVGTDIHWTEPESLSLDGRDWLQFTVDCKLEKIPISYQFYVYAGREGTFQVIGWTTQDLFNRDASRMREVMQTFQFPE